MISLRCASPASFTSVSARSRTDSFGMPLQVTQARAVEAGVAQFEPLQVLKSLEMREALVGDVGAQQVQLVELGHAFEIGQSRRR